MFFDDRLATVLRQRSEGEASVRTQYRQLLDILGNHKFGGDTESSHSLIAAAWLRMDALAEHIPTNERANMIRERGWRLRSADLTAHLAEGEPEIAAAALERADLSDEDWTAVIPRLPVHARGHLRLRDDLPPETLGLLDQLGVQSRGLPSPDKAVGAVVGEAEDALDLDEFGGEAEDTDEPFNFAGSRLFRDGKATSGDEAQQDKAQQDEEAKAQDAETASQAPSATRTVPLPSFTDSTESGRSEVSALVERIAQFKRNREEGPLDPELSPRLPLDDHLASNRQPVSHFGFAADAAGRIEWAEAGVAPSVIGTRLIAPRAIGSRMPETTLERAYRFRQPIVQSEVELAGASVISGVWFVDASPRFTEGGNFAGYIGRFRRHIPGENAARGPELQEADRIRQLLHELRTPVTAIQGYAEVIQQQLFGPAPHEYRALAASIAADAAHILSGFEELDRLAKLEAGVAELDEGTTDLSELVRRTVAQLTPVLAPRMAGLNFVRPEDTQLLVALDDFDAESLIWRVLATCGGGCASGEVLECSLAQSGNLAQLTCDIPAQLLDEDDIFAADAKPIADNINAGLFGAGFALRLARAEARSAGGGLSHDGERLKLLLPLLTEDGLTRDKGLSSHDDGSEAGGDA